MVATVTRTMMMVVMEVARNCCTTGSALRLPVGVRMLVRTTMWVAVVTDLASSFTFRAVGCRTVLVSDDHVGYDTFLDLHKES